MGKIPYMRMADINTLKANADAYLSHYNDEDNNWLNEVLGHTPFSMTKYDLPEINLYMPKDETHKELTDKNNVREVYSKLKFLTPSQASDERLWAGLCLGPFWKYVSYRWTIDSVAAIRQHYFFGYGPRRSLTRNAMSRLWRIGQLTYDSERQDPFELTDFVCENSRFIIDVLERNVSDSLPLMREFLGACLDLRKKGYQLSTKTIQELEKYMDILGGIYVLDYMPKGFLYNMIQERALKIFEQDITNIDDKNIQD